MERRKDRHENIGFGEIGFEALRYIVHHKDFLDVPKILETPYITKKDLTVRSLQKSLILMEKHIVK